jgi:flagellar biosynthesis protein FlhF
VLSATSKLKVLYETIEKFKYIGFSSIIFTKIDETSSVGSLLTIIKKYDVPISFITTGQTVPDDIEIATKERLKEIFIEGIN